MSGLLILAGGTGGHVFPALAVAKQLRSQGVDVAWLGTHKGLESTIVPANDISIEWVSVEGLRGKGISSWLLAPFKLMRAMWQSARAINKIQPDCVLGMGGFVAGPGGAMAKLLGKPLVIHEQNAVAGLTNAVLAKLANRVLTGFDNVSNLPSKAQWVGNPVREEITYQASSSEEGQVNVLVIGGSQGALSLNTYLPKAFSQTKAFSQSKAFSQNKTNNKLNIWHQSGRNRATGLQQAYQDVSMQAKVTEFIDDMAAAYAWADLVVCRAGAMTVAECCAAARPALLIPYPNSAGDHQLVNAQAMTKAGAGRIIHNKQLDSDLTVQMLDELLADKAQLQVMGKAAHKLHKPQALMQVVKVCEELMNA